jgi:hypothetical protein
METASFLDLNNEYVRLAVTEFKQIIDVKKKSRSYFVSVAQV